MLLLALIEVIGIATAVEDTHRGAAKKPPPTNPRTSASWALKRVPTYLFFFFFYFFRIFFIAFLGVSRHEEPRNSEKTFLQIFWS